MSQPAPEIWEARPPQELLLAVSLVAGLATLDALALGQLLASGQRSPEVPGALAIALACGQVAVATIFFTVGAVGFGRKGLLVAAAVAYGGALLAAGAAQPMRWDAACGELFILAAILALPGTALRAAGVRLVHRSARSERQTRPWQFTLEAALAALTVAACLFAALRWIVASKTSGIGVVLEWMLLLPLPWICLALISPPLNPLASLAGLGVMLAGVAVLATLVASFLGRPALGLTASVYTVFCAILLFILRWSGYKLQLAVAPQNSES